MISITELVSEPMAARLRVPSGSAWATYTRAQKQPVPSVVITGGFAIDHNSTGMSAVEHRWRP